MVHSQVLHPNIQVIEITRQFRSSASSLSAGELIKDEAFTLFEAVGALEIGDPKMDSGSASYDPEVEEEVEFTEHISPAEAIWLMDELVRREVAWHSGYPLSQTLFTSLHIERLLWPEPKRLIDANFNVQHVSHAPDPPSLLTHVFRPFCLGLVKCCDLVLSMIKQHHYYEEEDFASHVFNRPLLHDLPADEILELMQKAYQWLQDSDLPSRFKDALGARVHGRQGLLTLLQSCELGERPATALAEAIIDSIRTSESSTRIGCTTEAEAFTLKTQRQLASSVPPRPMVAVPEDVAFGFLKQLTMDAMSAFELFHVSCSSDVFVAYQTLMAQSPQPSIYVRALAQSFLDLGQAVLGQFSLKDFMKQDLHMLVLPTDGLILETREVEDRPSDQQMDVDAQLDVFLQQCGQSFLNQTRTFCLNRCRIRRTLCHAALEWDQIQANAEDLDSLIQSAFAEQAIPYPDGGELTYSYRLSSWVYHNKLVQLRIIVEMGFELSIYSPHEYPMMLWYLSFISSTHLSHLERISFFVSSTKSSQTSSTTHDIQTTLHHLYRQFTWLKTTEAMAKALHRLFVVAQRHGLLVQPTPTYSSDRLRYELRMRPFKHVSVPEPVSIELAQTTCALNDMPDELALQQASQLSQVAKKGWEEVQRGGWSAGSVEAGFRDSDSSATPVLEREWLKGIRNSIKACIGISIAASVLAKALREINALPSDDIAKKLRIDVPAIGDKDRWHTSWPVPKVSW